MTGYMIHYVERRHAYIVADSPEQAEIELRIHNGLLKKNILVVSIDEIHPDIGTKDVPEIT